MSADPSWIRKFSLAIHAIVKIQRPHLVARLCMQMSIIRSVPASRESIKSSAPYPGTPFPAEWHFYIHQDQCLTQVGLDTSSFGSLLMFDALLVSREMGLPVEGIYNEQPCLCAGLHGPEAQTCLRICHNLRSVLLYLSIRSCYGLSWLTHRVGVELCLCRAHHRPPR